MTRLRATTCKACFCTLVMIANLQLASPCFGDWFDDIGWTQLFAERAGAIKDGTGVDVMQVEAPEATSYMPYTGATQFSGKTFTDATGTGDPSNTATGHSESVGFMFYGNTSSISPGITNITVYEANDFLNNAIGFATNSDPIALPFQVQNHSYVASGLTIPQAEAILDRMDFIANQENATIVVGANNNGPTPQIYAHGYNSITVGRSDGGHFAPGTTLAEKLTSFNGVGRVKPEIVAPPSDVLGGPAPGGGARSSWAAGMVSGAASILREGESGNGIQNEVIKAQLLAGATKREATFGGNWDRTTDRPLDEDFGAGQLNIRNSYLIQEGGENEGFLAADAGSAAAATLFGWDYDSTFDPANDLHYNFEIAAGQLVDEFSAILTWNQEVVDNDGSSTFEPITSLANMDLELFDSSNTFVGTLLQESRSSFGGSPNGNVEHIYLTGLASGTYTLRVSGDGTNDYGLAWRVTTMAVPEPGTATIGILATAFCLLRRRR